MPPATKRAVMLEGVGRRAALLDRGCMDPAASVTRHFPLERAPGAVRMTLDVPGECLAMVTDVGEP